MKSGGSSSRLAQFAGAQASGHFLCPRRGGRSEGKHLVTCFGGAILGRAGALGPQEEGVLRGSEALFGVWSDGWGPAPAPLYNKNVPCSRWGETGTLLNVLRSNHHPLLGVIFSNQSSKINK